MDRIKRKCRDNDGNTYLIPQHMSDRFEQLIEIEKEMGAETSDLLARELAKYDEYREEQGK